MQIVHIKKESITNQIDTFVDDIYRFFTVIDYTKPHFFSIYDCWRNQSYEFSFQEEVLDEILEKVYYEIERLARNDYHHDIRIKIVQFQEIKNIDFSSELKDNIFDGWENNVKSYAQNSTSFFEGKKYYYNRLKNEVVYLAQNEIQAHIHFLIHMEYQELNCWKTINEVVKDPKTKQVLEIQGQFNHFCYQEIQKTFQLKNYQLNRLKRRLSYKWLTNINKHYIVPITDSKHVKKRSN